jgi:hypothetical protein
MAKELGGERRSNQTVDRMRGNRDSVGAERTSEQRGISDVRAHEGGREPRKTHIAIDANSPKSQVFTFLLSLFANPGEEQVVAPSELCLGAPGELAKSRPPMYRGQSGA